MQPFGWPPPSGFAREVVGTGTAATFRQLMLDSGLAEACTRMTAVAFSRKVAEALAPLRFRSVEIAASPHLSDAVAAVLRVSGSLPVNHAAAGA